MRNRYFLLEAILAHCGGGSTLTVSLTVKYPGFFDDFPKYIYIYYISININLVMLIIIGKTLMIRKIKII